jgi:CRISPR-associated protein (TIGR02584 family)
MGTPNSYARRILVAACGMTPQIVTETLYALRVTASVPYLVNEIRVTT